MGDKSTGLVFEWRPQLGVEPPATNLRDRSRYGSNGTFKSDGHPDWVREPNGLWLPDFDPTAPDYIEIPADQTQLNFTSEDFSIIARVKVNDLSGTRQIFERGSGSVDGYAFRITTTGQLYFIASQSGAFQTVTSSEGVIVAGTLHTVGLSRSGASVRLYGDGVDRTTGTPNITDPATCNRTAFIGVREYLLSYPFDGKIAYLGIWRYALSAGQHLRKHQELLSLGV